jgi:hypothetical protein
MATEKTYLCVRPSIAVKHVDVPRLELAYRNDHYLEAASF